MPEDLEKPWAILAMKSLAGDTEMGGPNGIFLGEVREPN
jgi:hypothetical protein